jgi:pyruvate dehydrogenase E2 component (dihydrolipoamide acetyltransferase)
MQVLVPDLGDFSDVEIIEILVAVGDEVQPEDPLLVVETDKATMEVPATDAGVIEELQIAVGDKVSTGDALLRMTVTKEPNAELATVEPVDDSAGADVAAGEADASVSVSGAVDFAVAADSAIEGAAVSAEVEVNVPDLGDFAEVEIIEVLVAVGDTVDVEDPLVALETDKATMEVPATAAGVIKELRVTVGDKVSTGDALLRMDAVIDDKAGSAGNADTGPKPSAADVKQTEPAANKTTAGTSNNRTSVAPAISESGFRSAHASPSVRKLARELGADLARVVGTGHKERITTEDLKAYVKQALAGGGGVALPEVPTVDFAAFGPVDINPLTRIQKIAGPRLHASWVNLPHVTQHDEADITALEEARQKLKETAAEQGARLTPLAFIVRACVLALNEFPRFASSLSRDGESLVTKHYRHIGFAADTPNGLVVPVIRDADKMNVIELASSLAEIAGRARDGKLSGDELQGGVFTISSLGGIGGTAFTPIINAPEVAILGVSRSQLRPIYQDGELVPRLILPLSLSYDHRVIDGAAAARFTTYLAGVLGEVDRLTEGLT